MQQKQAFEAHPSDLVWTLDIPIHNLALRHAQVTQFGLWTLPYKTCDYLKALCQALVREHVNTGRHIMWGPHADGTSWGG